MSQEEPVLGPANRRLDSWKEIAAFFDRDERTVRRWEKERSLPVHRMPGKPRGSVYAFSSELSQWLNTPNFPREETQGESPAGDSEILAREDLHGTLSIKSRAISIGSSPSAISASNFWYSREVLCSLVTFGVAINPFGSE